VTPDEIRALRKQLKCTMQELAAALEVEAQTVIAWEDGAMFPTKRFVEKMRALGEKGPGAVPRLGRRRASAAVAATPMQALADPELWRLLRKLIAHSELRRKVDELAAGYDDPA
jgi:transcriptional regulator with XRE-family HTH domain